MVDKKELIKKLVDFGSIKFGEFKLKSGQISKYYINLREAIEDDHSFNMIVGGLKQLVQRREKEKVLIVGVPNGALPIAGALAFSCNKGYLLLNKEKKTYGAGDRIVPENNKYIIVEDVMTTGGSIIETIEKIGSEKVIQAIVIVDRESGGVDNIQAKFPHIKVQSVLKISEMQEYLS